MVDSWSREWPDGLCPESRQSLRLVRPAMVHQQLTLTTGSYTRVYPHENERPRSRGLLLRLEPIQRNRL